MNRWKTGGLVAVMVAALAIVGCDQQGDDALDDLTSPGTDMTMPDMTDDAGTSPGTTDDMGASPSPTGS